MVASEMMAVSVGLTVTVLSATATGLASEGNTPLKKAWWRIAMPIILGAQTFSAANHQRWIIATFFVVGAVAVVAVAAWGRRKRL